MQVYKGLSGWKAKSSFPLGEGRELEIITYKGSKGMIVSIASVSRIEDGFKTCAVFSDFSKIINRALVLKITKEAVTKMHRGTLNLIDEIKAEAEAFYKDKQEIAA